MPTPKIRTPFPGGSNVGCDSCAFREASVTRREPYNTMKAMLCDLGGVPFYCHHDRSGHDFHADEVKPDVKELRICQGWAAKMRERAKDPRWREGRKLRKSLAQLGLGALELLVDNKDAQDRKSKLRTIRIVIEMLVLKKPRKLPIPKDAQVLHILPSEGNDGR
jgi:hypothetical protein